MSKNREFTTKKVKICRICKNPTIFKAPKADFNVFRAEKRKLLWLGHARTTRYSFEISKKISIDKSVRKSYNCHV